MRLAACKMNDQINITSPKIRTRFTQDPHKIHPRSTRFDVKQTFIETATKYGADVNKNVAFNKLTHERIITTKTLAEHS
jgi:hypothetical protein